MMLGSSCSPCCGNPCCAEKQNAGCGKPLFDALLDTSSFYPLGSSTEGLIVHSPQLAAAEVTSTTAPSSGFAANATAYRFWLETAPFSYFEPAAFRSLRQSSGRVWSIDQPGSPCAIVEASLQYEYFKNVASFTANGFDEIPQINLNFRIQPGMYVEVLVSASTSLNGSSVGIDFTAELIFAGKTVSVSAITQPQSAVTQAFLRVLNKDVYALPGNRCERSPAFFVSQTSPPPAAFQYAAREEFSGSIGVSATSDFGGSVSFSIDLNQLFWSGCLDCPPLSGACCNGTDCRVCHPCDCDSSIGEVFQGVGTSCSPNPCNPLP